MECLSGLCSRAPRKRRACLDGALRGAEVRLGRVAALGRYHRHPRQLSDDYTTTRKVLGVGRHGAVRQARCRRTGAFVAVKSLGLHGFSREQLAQLETETEVFLSVDHPNACRLLAVYEGQDVLHLVMERLAGGELLQRLRQRQRFSEQDAAGALWQMLSVVNYLHSHGMVHRDLKCENWVYDKEDSDVLKLIDFGTSSLRPPEARMSELVGTLAYAAPEVLSGSYTSRCDLWSLGVIAYTLLVGQFPFDGPDDVVADLVKAGSFPDDPHLWQGVSSSARDFVQSLLTVDPSVRLTAEQALQHPWLSCRGRPAPPCSHLDAGIAVALRSFANEPRLRRALLQVMAWCLTGKERDLVLQAFQELDTHRRGGLRPDDLAAALGEKLRATGGGGVRQIFEACAVPRSVDGGLQRDGCSDSWLQEITYSTFLAAALPVRIGIREELLDATFRALDEAGSGSLGTKDLERVVGGPLSAAELDGLRRCGAGSTDNEVFSSGQIAQYLREVFYALPECIGA